MPAQPGAGFVFHQNFWQVHQNLSPVDRLFRHPFLGAVGRMGLTIFYSAGGIRRMPYIHLMKVWTPLELFGIQLFKSDDRKWYVKRHKKPLRSLRGGSESHNTSI